MGELWVEYQCGAQASRTQERRKKVRANISYEYVVIQCLQIVFADCVNRAKGIFLTEPILGEGGKRRNYRINATVLIDICVYGTN